ncbi:hypothetical protein JCM16814_25750 [Desulfobaculum senezii]
MTHMPPGESPTRILSIASGKGGVGKTNVTVNLAWALGEMGHSVCILDADLGLSNVDILLGIQPRHTLEDVLFDDLPMRDAIMPVGPGVDLISGASGVPRLAELTRPMRKRLVTQCATLGSYDYIIIDNSPGITAQVTSLCLSAKDVILVVNPEATSITDAYALTKVLSREGLWWMPRILVNRARSAKQARLIFEKLRATAGQRLGLNCSFLGHIPEDRSIASASAFQRPLMETHPGSNAAMALRNVASRIRSTAVSKNRMISPHRFLDASVMRLKQTTDAPRKDPATGASTPILRHAIHELDRIDALLESIDTDVSPAQTAATRSVVRKRISDLRARLQSSHTAPPAAQPAPLRPISHQPAPLRAPQDAFEGDASSAPAEPKMEPAAPPVERHPALLLCPDDALRDLLVEMLTDTGYRVDLAPLPTRSSMPDFAPYRLGVVCWDGPAAHIESLLARTGETPVVWLRGYRRPPAAEPHLAPQVTIIDKPFSVSDLRRTFTEAAKPAHEVA